MYYRRGKLPNIELYQVNSDDNGMRSTDSGLCLEQLGCASVSMHPSNENVNIAKARKPDYRPLTCWLRRSDVFQERVHD